MTQKIGGPGSVHPPSATDIYCCKN